MSDTEQPGTITDKLATLKELIATTKPEEVDALIQEHEVEIEKLKALRKILAGGVKAKRVARKAGAKSDLRDRAVAALRFGALSLQALAENLEVASGVVAMMLAKNSDMFAKGSNDQWHLTEQALKLVG